jgi:hypothetical protein
MVVDWRDESGGASYSLQSKAYSLKTRGARTGRQGFTMTGTAVALLLFGLLGVVGFGILVVGQRSSARGGVQADLQQQALLLVYRLTQEIGEAREVLLPMRAGRMYPFVALRTLDQDLVLYVYQKATSRVVRQVVDPRTWDAVEESVVCQDVDSAGWAVDSRGQMVRIYLTLGRESGSRREILPVVTGVGVRSW